jgi:hypothetical protein
MLMFALFQFWNYAGVLIAGFNYGAEIIQRVKESVLLSIKYAHLASLILWLF